MPIKKWTWELVQEEAKKYDSVTAFKYGSSGAYSWAVRHDMVREVTEHMPPRGNRRLYTRKYVEALAEPFQTIRGFREAHPKAYRKASQHGFLREITARMVDERIKHREV